MGRSEVSSDTIPQVLFTWVFETGLLTGIWNSYSRLGRVATEPEESLCFYLPRAETPCAHTSRPGFSVWFWGLNSGPHAFKASTVLTEPPPQATSISLREKHQEKVRFLSSVPGWPVRWLHCCSSDEGNSSRTGRWYSGRHSCQSLWLNWCHCLLGLIWRCRRSNKSTFGQCCFFVACYSWFFLLKIVSHYVA